MSLLITIPSYILCATFLAIASFGIFLKASDTVTQDVVKMLFLEFRISDRDLSELAQFAAENDYIGSALIVVGLVMAVVCLLGLISAWNDWKILLTIYAAVLITLLFVEAIVLTVCYANPNELATPLLHTMEKLLGEYTDVSSNNSMAKAVWNTVMRAELKCNNQVYSKCCGINGYRDFDQRMMRLPRECCGSSFNCITSNAQATKAPGCKDKLTACTAGYSKYMLCMFVFALLLQNAFTVLPISCVFLTKLDLE
ncbi:hypothetical protein TcWFU_008952 [Taenia crassiceps]|uniref:Tetraspanin n=1 Tax=Taenia crassiceps TaxID=6207 RepID=A0ABR4Q8P0_9CEST